mgnify:FL=1
MDLNELSRLCREESAKNDEDEFDPLVQDDLDEALGLLEDCSNMLDLLTDPENKTVRMPKYTRKDVESLRQEIIDFLNMWNCQEEVDGL